MGKQNNKKKKQQRQKQQEKDDELVSAALEAQVARLRRLQLSREVRRLTLQIRIDLPGRDSRTPHFCG